MKTEMKRFFAEKAWVGGVWARDVLLTVDAGGAWGAIQAGASAQARAGAIVLDGPVLPGVVNAHSHAFQRAIAGLTERRGGVASDDFWSWRDRMYSVALRITPEQLENIAALLYAELLEGGYTHVCEFHYLHNAPDGKPYADPAEMSLALVRAAQRVGIGLTLLPTLYMRSGFEAIGLREDQRRFASDPESLCRLVTDLQKQTAGLANINVGVAVHSLRAVDGRSVQELADFAAEGKLPVHIHISEQTQEVRDCLAHTGQRPMAWLVDHLPVDERWNLVHATHATEAELAAVSARGAAIVICPTTEANLGDGVFDYPAYAGLGGRWSIGSDSHVTRTWTEELRLLEYSQRLIRQQRNVAATEANASTAAVLFEAALAGGQTATSRRLGGMEPGRRADFAVLDEQSSALQGIPTENLLDALVFSSPDARCKQVFVGGAQATAHGQAGTGSEVSGRESRQRVRLDFSRTMRQLWA